MAAVLVAIVLLDHVIDLPDVVLIPLGIILLVVATIVLVIWIGFLSLGAREALLSLWQWYDRRRH